MVVCLHPQRLFNNVVEATTFAPLLDASPVLRGFANLGERNSLNGLLRKLTQSGFLPVDYPSFEEHCYTADLSPIKSMSYPSLDHLPTRKVNPHHPT